MENGSCLGVTIIFDCEGVNFGHLAKIQILPIKRFMYFVQEVLPIHIKGLHFVNAPGIIEKLLFILKPFLKKELLDVMYTHKTVESLFTFIEPELLPADYPGGKQPSVKELHGQSAYSENRIF